MNTALLSCIPSHRSRRVLAGGALVPVLAGLVACGGDNADPAEPSVATETAAVSGDGLPIDAQPVEEANGGQCSFLDNEWVQETNGQRVLSTGTDERFDPPACIFYSYDEGPQLRVWVRQMATPEEATAVVDWAAPIDSTDPADTPEGWMGGRQGTETGSLFAVAKGTTAVVVFSNQPQSVKAELVAVETITRLGL